jgi:hypothetical protein
VDLLVTPPRLLLTPENIKDKLENKDARNLNEGEDLTRIDVTLAISRLFPVCLYRGNQVSSILCSTPEDINQKE